MFSFIKNRKAFYVLALVLIVASFLAPWGLGVHQGIDMTGGIQIEYSAGKLSKDTVLSKLKSGLVESVDANLPKESSAIITDKNIYGVSNQNSFVVETGIDEAVVKKADGAIDFEKIETAKNAFKDALLVELQKIDPGITQSKYVNIGASFGDYIKNSGYKSLIGVILAISLYILYAFRGSIGGMVNWPFSVVTALTLFHDVVIAFGLYTLTSFFLPEFKIDTFFITAMLTVLGYSINDTIVVMDRIRSNLQDGHHGSKKK